MLDELKAQIEGGSAITQVLWAWTETQMDRTLHMVVLIDEMNHQVAPRAEGVVEHNYMYVC